MFITWGIELGLNTFIMQYLHVHCFDQSQMNLFSFQVLDSVILLIPLKHFQVRSHSIYHFPE